jgi:phosphoenolpyruvate carboxylase
MNTVQLICLLGMEHFAGNPQVTPEVTRDVCLLARLMAANLYFGQIEDLMFEVEQHFS